jgi:hypothetical protein
MRISDFAHFWPNWIGFSAQAITTVQLEKTLRFFSATGSQETG